MIDSWGIPIDIHRSGTWRLFTRIQDHSSVYAVYGCVVNNKQQNPVKWFVITCSWNTYFKFLFSWCLFDFCPCKDTGRKHEEQWKIWHVTSRSPAGHFVQCALTGATHLTLALCFLCVTILLSAVRFLYLMSFSAVLCLYLSSSWPCPAPCPSIWMYTTSVNLHLDFSSSPCTGHAQSQPSQLSGERVFTLKLNHCKLLSLQTLPDDC